MEKLKADSLMMYEYKEWIRIDNHNYGEKEETVKKVETDVAEDVTNEMNETAIQLRKLRKKIHKKLNLWQNACFDLQKYQSCIDKFLSKFNENLTSEDISMWKHRLKVTEEAFKKFERAKMSHQCSNKDETDEENYKFLPKSIPKTTENFTDDLIDLSDDKILSVEQMNPLLQKVFISAREQEILVKNLPDVPKDSFEEVVDDSNPIDLEIEVRLERLKSFRRSLCQNDKTKEEFDDLQATPRSDSEKFFQTENSTVTGPVVDKKEGRSKSSSSPIFSNLESTSYETLHTYDKLTSSNQVDDNDKLYTQLSCICSQVMFKQQQQLKEEKNVSAILCYIQVYFILMLATYKLFNDKITEFTQFSSATPFRTYPLYDANNSSVDQSCYTSVETSSLLLWTKRVMCQVASACGLWFNVKIWVKVKSVKEITMIPLRNLVSMKSWSKFLSESSQFGKHVCQM